MSMVADARPVVYPPRACSNTYGVPKVGYPSRRVAAHMRRVLRVFDQKPYACTCGAYHLGHPARKQRGRA